ncbi:MAG TPA: TIGR01777 family oxidoreductase [Thermoanaerobaculia bacterium]|nr:TIGR01777 family oxidoreductase [Thermoanaerobaculia bacterium]
MKIVVAGGSGFLGGPLVRRLVARGDDVAVLSRNPSKVTAGRGVRWDGKTAGPWTAEIDDAHAVVNLAGENIGEGRWTSERKRKLHDSRVDATGALAWALLRAPARKRTLVSASAVGYYGFESDEPLDESAPKGRGFLADLTAAWEEAAKRAEPAARVVIPRFGVVLATDGGALPKMAMPFRIGAGGPVGNGRQWFSWVDRDDALDAIQWALDGEGVRGVYNISAPDPVRNRDFARSLGRALHRPSLIPAPAFALRLLFGDMADEALLGGQRALPKRALAEGFVFCHDKVENELQRLFTT